MHRQLHRTLRADKLLSHCLLNVGVPSPVRSGERAKVDLHVDLCTRYPASLDYSLILVAKEERML
jgi:hypothetical protein